MSDWSSDVCSSDLHVIWETNRRQDHAAIEIDIGIELLFDEIFIVESDMLQFPSDIKDGVADAQLVQHFLGRFLHDFGARIVIFIHTVSKAHQAERIVLVFRSGDIFGDSVDGPDFTKHIESSFVGAAMSRTPKAGDTCRDAGEGVCAGGTSKTNNKSEEQT